MSKFIVVILLAMLLSACSVRVGNSATEVPTELPFNTPTLPPTATPRPTATVVTPSITPTVSPVEGTVSTQINVRAAPDKNSVSEGLLKAGETVQIVGQNEAGDWWLIQYPPAESGLGWVSAAYIQSASKPDVPVVNPEASKPTPLASPTPLAGLSAKTVEKVNVRSGPGTGYNSLGTIDPGSSLTLTGKNETGTWLQIYKAGGPGDRGWVSAAYVQVDGDTNQLPVLDEMGTPVAQTPGTPEAERATSTPVIAPAADDGDSAQKPAISILFSPQASRKFIYSNDVSTPQGDSTDWLQFAPYSPQPGQTTPINLGLTCDGNGSVNVELWQNGTPLSGWGSLACGGHSGSLSLAGDSTYLLKLSAAEGTGDLQSVKYTLTASLGQ
jgi:uncharacterized protein YraI